MKQQMPKTIYAGPGVNSDCKYGDWDLDGQTITYGEYAVRYVRAEQQDVVRAAVRMWRAEALRAGMETVAKRRTMENFIEEAPETMTKWIELAAAALNVEQDDD